MSRSAFSLSVGASAIGPSLEHIRDDRVDDSDQFFTFLTRSVSFLVAQQFGFDDRPKSETSLLSFLQRDFCLINEILPRFASVCLFKVRAYTRARANHLTC
jgi:hypothetical protein